MSAQVIVSSGALAIAAISAIASWRTSQRQVALQERLLTLEHGRERERKASQSQAQLRADILPSHNNSYKLRIRNDGPGQARAIQITVDGTALEKSDRVLARDEVIRTLGGGAQAQYHVMAFLGMNRMFRVRIEWVDDSDDSRSWESELKI